MKLQDPKLKIVTVHSSGMVRNLINTELRSRGYVDVQGAPDLGTAIEIMETGMIHWLITPIIIEDKFNVFQILKMIADDPRMTDMRISFLAEQVLEPEHLSKAFDLGLMSYHAKMVSKTDVEAEFKQLFDLNKEYGEDFSLLAGAYVRQLLRETGRKQDLLGFEKALFQHHKGNLKQLLNLGEAFIEANQFDVGKGLLSQALLIDPALSASIEEIFKRRGIELPKGSLSPASVAPEILGIKTCLLVDQDPGVLNQVTEYLGRLGVTNIFSFQDPFLAIQWLKSNIKPELVIFEWRLDQMPGPILVQKLRSVLGYGVPLTVMNRDLTERDMPVLHEMGVTNRISKPIEELAFYADCIWVMNQERSPSEPFVILQKIKQAMHEKSYEQLASLTKRYMSSEKVSEPEKSTLEGELAYFRGHYSLARNLALDVLKKGHAKVGVLNLLGKVMMKLRDFESALRCLENADVLSPNNVQRICNIAEVHLEMGNAAAFSEQLTQAKSIAGDTPATMEVEVKGALMQGDRNKARDLMQSLESLLSILSFTNNRAIALIRTDRFDEGMKLYSEAIKAIPSQRPDVLAILHYNHGLALARLNRLKEASQELEKANQQRSEKMRGKIASLKSRVDKAIVDKAQLELNVASAAGQPEEVSVDPQKDFEELMSALTVNPGDLCCHKLFIEPKISSNLKGLIERPLRLKKRSAIQKASSLPS